MIDREAAENLWTWVDVNYIQPEFDRRRGAGLLPPDFTIRQFRILLPKDRPPLVEFNDEVGWHVKAKRGDGTDFALGAPVYLHEFDRVESVNPPEIEGKRVPFIFFGWDGTQYRGCFDFASNWSEEALIAQGRSRADKWSLSEFLSRFLQGRIEEHAAQMCLSQRDALRRIGLWLVPILIPYPLRAVRLLTVAVTHPEPLIASGENVSSGINATAISRAVLTQIAYSLSESDETAARSLLISFCNAAFLEKCVSNWWTIAEFAFRRPLVEEALWAHRAGKYHLSVSTLLPHLEGIVVHWEFSQGMNARFRPESRIRDFSQRTQVSTPSPFLYNSVHRETIDFILSGPVMSVFQNWQDTLDPAFPNRHAVGHGRYDSQMFTEEASIKVFLLLDTVKQIIAAQNQQGGATNDAS